MTGPSYTVIITPIVAVICLATWLIMIYYADSHPQWKNKSPRRQPDSGPAPLTDQRPHDVSPALPAGTRASGPAEEAPAGPVPRPRSPHPAASAGQKQVPDHRRAHI